MSATLPSPQRPRVSALRLYPIKGLCPVNVPSVVVRPGGKGLQYDRQWALLNPEGRYVNGKSCPALHRIRLTAFTPPSTVRMQREDEAPVEFVLDSSVGLAGAEAWLRVASGVAGAKLVRVQEDTLGFTDDPRFDGPTMVSQATLDVVSSWFSPALTDAADRFRPNIIVDGVPPFWEDLLVSDDKAFGVSFTLGSVVLMGAYPVHRCVVPTRAPSSSDSPPGTTLTGFMETFQVNRRRTFVEGAPVERLTHGKPPQEAYFLCTACVVSQGGTLAVGDSVTVSPGESQLQPVLREQQALSAATTQRIIDRAFAIRSMSGGLHRALSVVVAVLPTALSGAIITGSLPPTVRKPTKGEVALGAGKVALVLAAAWFAVTRLRQ